MIMRRESGTVSFGHNWLEYENGFGDLDTEFWLGKKDINNEIVKTKKKPINICQKLSNKLTSYFFLFVSIMYSYT